MLEHHACVCMCLCICIYYYLIHTSTFHTTIGALHGSFGMDCLVVVGTTVTFVYSCVQLSLACSTGEQTKHVFFEASGMLLMFVTFGKYLEAYAKGKTVSAITNLLSMQPSHALLVVNSESINYTGGNGACTVEGSRHPPTPLSVPPFSPTISPIRGYGAISTIVVDRAAQAREMKAGIPYQNNGKFPFLQFITIPIN